MVQKKRTKQKMTKKTAAKKSRKRKRVTKAIEQVREPLALLDTLREEGIERLLYWLSMGSEFARNLGKQGLGNQVHEVVQLLGLATQDDLRNLKKKIRRLEARIEDLEEQLEGAVVESVEVDEAEAEEDMVESEIDDTTTLEQRSK